MRYKALLENSVVIFFVAVAACSLEVGNPKKPKPTGTEELTQAAIDSELIAEQADMGLTSASEGAESTQSASLALTSLEATNETPFELANTTSCQEIGGTATQIIKRENTWSTPETRKNVEVSVNRTRSLERTRTVAAAGAYCDTNNFARVPWANVSSATISTNLTRSLNFTVTVPDALGTRMPASRQASSELTQTLSITKSQANGVTTLQKSLTYEGTHTVVVTHRNGTSRTVNATAQTLSPIVTTLTFAGATLQSKTVNSGSTKSTNSATGEIIEQTFSALTYSDATSCVPTSGNIAGIIKNADASTRETFTVVFENGKGTLTFASTGESQTYVPECL